MPLKKVDGKYAWEYSHTVEVPGVTLHVWTCEHDEGYTAYTITHQPEVGSRIDFVKPSGNQHWTGEDAFNRYIESWRKNT
jgi:hypothetical protein